MRLDTIFAFVCWTSFRNGQEKKNWIVGREIQRRKLILNSLWNVASGIRCATQNLTLEDVRHVFIYTPTLSLSLSFSCSQSSLTLVHCAGPFFNPFSSQNECSTSFKKTVFLPDCVCRKYFLYTKERETFIEQNEKLIIFLAQCDFQYHGKCIHINIYVYIDYTLLNQQK